MKNRNWMQGLPLSARQRCMRQGIGSGMICSPINQHQQGQDDDERLGSGGAAPQNA